jgi:hypothetical protein
MHFGCISKINTTCFSKFVKNTTKQIEEFQGECIINASIHIRNLQIEGDAKVCEEYYKTN